MATEKHIRGNRENPKKSTGPGDVSLVAAKNGKRFRNHVVHFHREFSPAGATKRALVDTIADARYRTLRMATLDLLRPPRRCQRQPRIQPTPQSPHEPNPPTPKPMKNQAPNPANPARKSASQGFAKASQSVRFRFAKALHWTEMLTRPASLNATLSALLLLSFTVQAQPPRAGKVEIMKASDVKPGMKATAWTVFQGDTPEAVPIEIIGNWRNMWGPGQDVIVGKMGGKAERTNVAGGMSGSPVYIDGKLVGAVALRLSQFSPDAICGITPIELMLEINQFDQTRPSDARTPDKAPRASAGGPAPPALQQIATPLLFSGFHEEALQAFAPLFNQLGVQAAQGGAAGTVQSTKPARDWQNALQPGQSVAGVLVSGDMGVTGLGTVTYNDGKRILAFGHPFFNIGPVDMPMSKGEVLMVLSSAYQPNKIANATEIVGALHQDRHSGIMGVLGDEAPMAPVSVKVRSLGPGDTMRSEKTYHFNVFQQQKWTPQLMMMTLYNSLTGINDSVDEATYRLTGTAELTEGGTLHLTTLQTSGDMPMPAPMIVAAWWGDKFNRLFNNAVKVPSLKSADVTVDLLPERRIATIENAWTPNSDVRAGDEIPVKVFLRPWRGERLEREFRLKLPAGLAKGEHRILVSDADTANRIQSLGFASNRYMDVPQLVSLINQERGNNKLYVSLVAANPTAFYEDKTLPSLPSSILNVMQAGRTAAQAVLTSPESASEQTSLPFDYVVNGSYTLRLTIK